MIDLHTHTTASDGSVSPFELISKAKEAGFCAIAVTDHDTVAAVPEAKKAGAALGIEVISGVELSCDYPEEMHIVGLFVDYTHPELLRVLAEQKKKREQRNLKTLSILNELGLSVTLEEVRAVATGDVWGRAHFAKVLCDKGYVESVKDGFRKYLGSGRVAHVNEQRLLPEEAIRLIRLAGGIPILAHMHYLKLDLEELRDLLIELQRMGLMGVEVIYSEYTEAQSREYTKLSEELNLLKSGGSDFHGAMKPHIPLTPEHLKIPYTFLKEIKQYVRTF